MTMSRGLRIGLVLAVVAALVGGAVLTLRAAGVLRSPEARSVIFISGDGMAAAHREAARLYYAGTDGKLTMDSLPVSGSQTTSPADPRAIVTDSAAAGSAWATGQRTYNGAISVDADGKPLAVLGAEAAAAGRATGLVTTSQVTDASPAAFFSATPNRALQTEIARQYLEVTTPDVILGGGEDWWLPAGTPGAYPDAPAAAPEEGSRSTEGDLIGQARGLGYQYVSSAEELASADGDRLLGLFANQAMFRQHPEGQGDEYDPVVPLADMTRKALDVLSRDEDGFFLFVEEEAVDEMSHTNNGARMLDAMGALEAAVEVARAYVREHPDTLLIVAGDHESGGLAVEEVVSGDESGPGGTLDPEAPSGAEPGRGVEESVTISGEDGPFAVAGSDKQFVLDWTTTSHTSTPTPVTADGPGSERLHGTYPNTHLHAVVREILVG